MSTPAARWLERLFKHDLARALCIYLATRVALFIFVWLTGQHYTCYGIRCSQAVLIPSNFVLNGLFQWDARHYLALIERGYFLEGETTAPFFPGFPLAAWLGGKLVGSPLWGGILVNHLASIAGAVVIARLSRALELGGPERAEETAHETTLFWLASPLAFFHSVFLSESLFAFLSVLMIWAVVRGHWWLVLVSGILVTATRSAGVIVAAGAFVLAFERRALVPVGVHGWCCLALTPLGLAGLMAWQHRYLGDALAWSHTQVLWNRVLTTPWRTLTDDWLGFPVFHEKNVDKMYRAQEVLALLLVAPLLFLRKQLKLPWGLLLLGAAEWLLPLTSHSLSSSARYQAGNVYFALAIPVLLVARPTLRGLCWMLFGMVFAWYASTFPHGVWGS